MGLSYFLQSANILDEEAYAAARQGLDMGQPDEPAWSDGMPQHPGTNVEYVFFDSDEVQPFEEVILDTSPETYAFASSDDNAIQSADQDSAGGFLLSEEIIQCDAILPDLEPEVKLRPGVDLPTAEATSEDDFGRTGHVSYLDISQSRAFDGDSAGQLAFLGQASADTGAATSASSSRQKPKRSPPRLRHVGKSVSATAYFDIDIKDIKMYYTKIGDCLLCGNRYHGAQSASRHIKLSHMKLRNYQCPQCPLMFQVFF
jgi:hypothetical protein